MRVYGRNGSTSSVNVQYCNFLNNTATYGAAADIVQDDPISGFVEAYFESCIFDQNVVTQSGGALRLLATNSSNSNLEVLNSDFSSNQADFFGGAISSTMGQFFVSLSSCNYNHANSGGGAVYRSNSIGSGYILSAIDQSDFNGNTAHDGGALYLSSNVPAEPTFVLNQCTLHSNSSTNRGGAIYLSGSAGLHFQLTRSTISNNSSDAFGGAFSCFQNSGLPVSLTFSECDFISNSVNDYGAAIDLIGGVYLQVSLDKIYAEANYAGIHGGFFHYLAGTSDTIDISVNRSWFYNNVAASKGAVFRIIGSVLNSQTNASFENSVFLENSADQGGTMSLLELGASSEMLVSFNHLSMIGNDATLNGKLVRADASSGTLQLDIENTLIDQNDSGISELETLNGAVVNSSHNLWTANIPANVADLGSNLTGYAILADISDALGPDGIWASDDDGVKSANGSPLLDASSPSDTSTVDITGAIRPGSSANDIGAYEGVNGNCSVSTAPTDLSSSVEASGVSLNWKPTPNSVGCQIQGRPLGAPAFGSLVVSGLSVSEGFVPAPVLTSGTSYEWMLRCACSTAPLQVTPLSELDTFFWPMLREEQRIISFEILPNPSSSDGVLQARGAEGQLWNLTLLDISGRVIFQDSWLPEFGNDNFQLPPMSDYADGLYKLQIQNQVGLRHELNWIIAEP